MSYPDIARSLPALEEEILARWREEDLFVRVQEDTAEGPPFVFYEGPPTANGRPGLHHVLSRTVKDLVCRFRNMQGRQVTRIAGWDTHGLPVEIEAERRLGISGKPEIEAVGVARFNEVCRDSVFTYKEEWEQLSQRIGYWLDYSNPYVTFHTGYMESVWWILQQLAEKGLLYRGQKSVPYCPRCGTALSSHEVAQGYEDVEDPSLYFLCDWLDAAGGQDPERRTFLVWTTTPWTVPSNTALAVRDDLIYAEVEWQGRRVILAEARVEALFGEGTEVLRRYTGAELVGVPYRRPLEMVPLTEEEAAAGWRVISEEFVTAEDGSGLVHLAPAFGADDYAAGQRHGLPLLRPVDDRGCFREGIGEVGGRFVKDADPLLVESLERSGGLFRIERMVHSYPHCWRCRSPLIYMARDSWFAATSTLKEEMLRENAQVGWNPPEVGEGRFGEWLANNVDWALSRDRFWGTPLPVWVSDGDPTKVQWIGSLEELAAHAGGLPPDFDPHRPYIDEITWPCPRGTGTMRRDPSVLDVWFDSGAMPWAQWQYPRENAEHFEAHFPADFICEGLDQTRGWFYSLLAISTMLGKGRPYRNVIVNGLLVDAEGQKMSKSRGNVVNPWDAVTAHGADGLRWYFTTVSHPWALKRYDPEAVEEASRRLFDGLYNTYRFFQLYANVEGWRPSDTDPPATGRPLMDRWILSRLEGLVEEVTQELEAYQLTRAYRPVADFLNEDLSNWYVRRCRPRFWGNTDRADRDAAFRTLHDVLVTLLRLLAPVVPFVSDAFHRALTGVTVHRAGFPTPAPDGVGGERDLALEREMEVARALVSLGRAAREEVQIRVRQPLRTLHAVVSHEVALRESVVATIREELNVKEVRFLTSGDGLVTLSARPNFRALGPRFQKRSQEMGEAIRALTSSQLEAFQATGVLEVEVGGERVALESGEFDVVQEARGELVIRSHEGMTVALDPTLDDELRREGLARELVNRIQRLRKESGLEITDRIVLHLSGGTEVLAAAEEFGARIREETLTTEMRCTSLDQGERPTATPPGWEVMELDGHFVGLRLEQAGL